MLCSRVPGSIILKLLDLLYNSFVEVCAGGDEVKSQTKAFSTASVNAAEDMEAFEVSQDVFDAETPCAAFLLTVSP